MQQLELLFKNTSNDKINNRKSECANNKADGGIEDSIFGFFGFLRVAIWSHIIYTADNDENYCDEADDADNGI